MNSIPVIVVVICFIPLEVLKVWKDKMEIELEIKYVLAHRRNKSYRKY